MDTKILVNQIRNLIADFAKEKKIVTCVHLVRAYPDYESSSFVLAISCPWTANYKSCFAKTQEVVTKVYKCLDSDSLGMIHSVNVFDSDIEVEKFVKSGGEEWIANYCSEFINPIEQFDLVEA
jgi:phosphopantetheine adenylyltransferase